MLLEIMHEESGGFAPAQTHADNPWIEQSDSPIHGGGLFARRTIPRGTRIIEYVGPKLTKAQSTRRANALIEEASQTGNGAVFMFTLNKRHDIDGNVPWNTARFINHSCDPNCEPIVQRGRIWIVTLRTIPAGEELCYNYGYDAEHWREHPCLCASQKCVGHIVARAQWPVLKRLKRRSIP